MKNFETVFIAKPNLKDEEVKSLIKQITDLISKNGEIIRIEELGKKKLAYEIQKFKEGIYVIIKFTSNPILVEQLEKFYRIKDEIMRFLTIENWEDM